jgi:DNA-binding transcriptional regulator LsrR (DeoR family)
MPDSARSSMTCAPNWTRSHKHRRTTRSGVKTFGYSTVGVRRRTSVVTKRDSSALGSPAAWLAELLPAMKVVGVTWGNTIRYLLEALGTNHPKQLRNAKPTFVPLSGELLNDPSIWLSSTSLVAQLHRVVHGQSGDPPLSLGAAPARIPYRFQATKQKLTKGERESLRALTGDILGYRKVFRGWTDDRTGERHGPLVKRLDSLLACVGCDYSQSKAPWLDEVTSREELSPEDLDRLTHGDLAGVFLSKATIKQSGRKAKEPQSDKLDKFNSRWMGAKEEDIGECAARAAKNKTPGVILVAVGKRKAGIVTECVRQGLVNQLIIDYDLARAIVDLPDIPTG